MDVHAAALRSMARVIPDDARPTEPMAARRRIGAALREGGVVALTGAGMSTGSGIPDYRGPHGSLRRQRPLTFPEMRDDAAACRTYWARSFVGWRRLAEAEPNPAHRILARFEEEGRLAGIITQNVDGLHRRAGSRRVLPLHGTLDVVQCLDCGARESRRTLDARLAAANPGFLAAHAHPQVRVHPDGDAELPAAAVAAFRLVGCRRCGSRRLKPAVIYFGEPVPAARREIALEAVRGARMLLVLGSSLAVMSGYRLVIEAQRTGVPVAVINAGPGRADHRVEVLWRARLEPALRALAAGLDA